VISLGKRSFVFAFVLVAAAVLAAHAIVVPRAGETAAARARERLYEKAMLIAPRAADVARRAGGASDASQANDQTGAKATEWDRLADEAGASAGARVLLVAGDGAVLGDSHMAADSLARAERQIDRTEVREAAARGRGHRLYPRGGAAGTPALAVAVAWDAARPPGGFLHLSAPTPDARDARRAAQRAIFAAAACALAIAWGATAVAMRRVAAPIAELARIARRGTSGDPAIGAATADGETSPAARAARTPHDDDLAQIASTVETLVEDLSRVSSALRMERDLQAAILEGMREGILVLDRGRRIVLANATLREFFLAGAEVQGRTSLEAFRSLSLEAAIDAGLANPEGAEREVEVTGLRPRLLLARVAAVTPEPESPLLAVFHDITELRRLEGARRDFVANASHELRTPVAAIRGAAEVLEGEALGLSEEARSYAEIIRRRSAQMAQLVDDLLDLSRIESGRTTVAAEDVDLRRALESAAAGFADAARARGIRIEIAATPFGATALVDPTALRQVLRNLVDNTVKYSVEGGTITLRATVDPGTATISVEDTGPGIEAAHLPRLFERFYRVDVSRSRSLGGTGLGLAIVKHLVEAMGGTIGVESIPGTGTTFRFTLPRGG
jgi:two-component system phosphate regulon sensor histidine kinase PhoR